MNYRNNIYIIAEAGVNHNGSQTNALELVDAAADAGADAVKFQTFSPEALAGRHVAKAKYQQSSTGAQELQLDMLRRLALTEGEFRQLFDHCQRRGIDFLSSPFDVDSASFLCDSLRLKRLKIGSGEITNGPLLLQIARTGIDVILSTGMSMLGEIETALGVLAFGFNEPPDASPALDIFQHAYASPQGQYALHNKVTLLHCTTEYPCPYPEVNLRAMDTLAGAFGLPVGLSDHSLGYAVAIAAVARGAAIIEKHFTLDRSLPGPDQWASLEPGELKCLIADIRHIEQALGSGIKYSTPSERQNMAVVRKILVAARAIKMGEVFTAKNLTAKRAGNGLSPMHYWELLGRTASKNYAADEEVVQ